MNELIVQKNFINKVTFAAKYCADMAVMQDSYLVRVDCGLPSNTFNVAVVLADDINENVINKDLLTYYNDKQYPFAVWCWDHLPNAKKQLDASSLTVAETAMAMVATVEDLKIVKQESDDYHIKQIDTAEEMETFGSILSSLWGDSSEVENVRKYCHVLAVNKLYLNKANRFYLGYFKEKPVCTASVIYTDDSAGIYDLATLSDYRKQGLGSTMFNHLLAKIKENGYSQYTLQASEDGANIYKKTGFTSVNIVYIYENEF